MVRNNTCKCMLTLCKKNAYGLVYVRLFNCAAASLPWRLLRTYLESCANIVQAVVYCPPYRPPSCWQSVARRCSLKKSVLIHASSWRGRHCVLHKHHPIIRVGAGLIQHLRLTTEATRKRNAFLPFFPRVHSHLFPLFGCLVINFPFSVAPRPPAGPMSILLSANRNLENPRPENKILFTGSHTKIPRMGFGTRKQKAKS